MSSKKSLMIKSSSYKYLLRKNLRHNNYLNGQHTLKKQDSNFLDAEPEFTDYITGTETFQISLPYPITNPRMFENEIDYGRDLLDRKEKYYYGLKQAATTYKNNDEKYFTKVYVQKTKYAKLPKYFLEISEDPDSNFEGCYNWYYTGGILEQFSFSNVNFLIHAVESQVNIINLDSKDVRLPVLQNFNNQTSDRSPISKLRMFNDKLSNILMIGKKDCYGFYSLTCDDDNFTMNHMKTFSKPLLDSIYHDEDIAFIDFNRKLSIQNVYNGKVKVNHKFKMPEKELSNSFCQINYLDQNNIGFIDRESLRFFDTRSRDERIYPLRDEYFTCADLCTFTHKENSPYIFICSTHNIIKFDARQNKAVKTWVHMLSSPPLIMKSINFDFNDMYFITSQLYNERIILYSNKEESNLVQLVPNNMETLKRCNTSHKFDLLGDVYKSRLQFSTVGIEIIKNGNDLSLFSCNTLGDVFRNDLSRTEIDPGEHLEEFASWKMKFTRKPKPVVASHVRNLSNVKDVLYEPLDLNRIEKYTERNKLISEFLADNTVDQASTIASAWSTERPTVVPVTEGAEMNSTNKVADWLQRTAQHHEDGDEEIKKTEIFLDYTHL